MSSKTVGMFPNLNGRPRGFAVKTKMKQALPDAYDLVLKHSKTDLLAAIEVIRYNRELESQRID